MCAMLTWKDHLRVFRSRRTASIKHLTQRWPPRAVPNLSNGVGGSSLISNYDAKNGLIQWITNTLKGLGVGNDTTCLHITVAGTTCCF
jgi:hypothetical protein